MKVEAEIQGLLENIKRKIAEGLLIPILRQNRTLPGRKSPIPTVFMLCLGFKSREGFGESPPTCPTQPEQEWNSFWCYAQSVLGSVFGKEISGPPAQGEDAALLRRETYPV